MTKSSSLRISTAYHLILLALFIGAAFIAVFMVNHAMKKQALEEALSKARIILDRNLATHTYFSRDLKPKVFELTDSYRPKNYFEPTWMSSTFAVRRIDQYAKSLSPTDYYYKECAINARSPGNEADDYERSFIQRLNRDPHLVEQSEVRVLGEKPFFVILRRGESMEESCLRCHSTPGQAPGDLVRQYGPERSFHRNVGDVVSAISIRVPLAAAYANADRFSLLLSTMLLIVLGVLFLIQLWVSKRLIFIPLASIRNKAIQIATDEHSLGETINVRAGRELNDLASAFNTMSISLRRSREGLETLVQERTAKLQKALDNVKKLSGMLPICSSCKKVRDDAGYWNQIETYIREHSEAEFSHGICPDCARKLYPDYFKNE